MTPDSPECSREPVAAAPVPTLLKQLVREHGCASYRRFRKEWNRAALSLGNEFRGTEPSERTYKRWLAGNIGGIPRYEASAVLHAMFPDFTVEQLFRPPCATDSATADGSREVDDVNRKEFLAAIAATVIAPRTTLFDLEPSRVVPADVERYRENLGHLYALDDHYGATRENYSLTVRSMGHLAGLLESASYSPEVGDQLRQISASMMEHAGWLAFDAGHQHDARRWWLEALHAARMADAPDTEVLVLATMSFAANHGGRGRETVDLATTAAKVARRGRSTPRLASLLAAREAAGHAHLGDQRSTRAAMERATAELERGQRDDDPDWLSFWGRSDLASHACSSALRTGDQSAAERLARDAVAAVDVGRFPRNHAVYQADLAEVLALRDLDEALPVIASAALQAANLNSARVTRKVTRVVSQLQTTYQRHAKVGELADWTRTNLTISASWPMVQA